MKRIVIMTHALMARGLKETAEFLAGESGIVSVCCFTEEQDPDAYIDALLKEVPEEDKLIIMTDIMGGSVNQKAGRRLSGHAFYLLSGINLPLLLEIAVADESMITEEFIRDAVEDAKKEIVFVNDRLTEETSESPDADFFG